MTRTETTSFVITYNQTLSNIALIIHKHFYVFYSSDRCRNVFENLPSVACNDITGIPVRAQIHCQKLVIAVTPGLLRVVFGATEGTASPVRTLIIIIEHGRNQHDTFYSTGEMTYIIKSHLTLDTFIVIYMIECRLCNLQYIGETKGRLKHRIPNPTTE